MRIDCPLALAIVLVARTGHADCSGSETNFVSPGVLASFDLTHGGAFGLGAEVSYSNWIATEKPYGFGAFLNAVHYFAPVRGRFAAGGQWHATALGGEAGWSHFTASNEEYGLGSASGFLLGGFLSVGVVMVALRGTFEGSGDPNAPSTTLDFGFKLPLAVTSHHVAYANSDCLWADHH